jgi:nucleosome assembly protein 1-like 1
MDIKGNKGRLGVGTAPTPNNTPSVQAPISSLTRPPFPSTIREESSRPGDLFSPGQNQQLVNMLQGRLGTLVGAPSGYVESLPAPVQRRIRALEAIGEKHVELEKAFHMEVLELEKKYASLFQPGYERRAALVNGQVEPEEEADDVDEEEVKGVPEFWLTAFKNHYQLMELIQDKDEPVLKHLVDVRTRYHTDKPGFALDFVFSENDYFDNSTLTKTYYYQHAEHVGDLVYESAQGTDIEWKQGKNLTVETITKTQRHKATKKTRTITKTIPSDSFFTFFKTLTIDDISSDEDDEDEDADFDKEELLRHKLDADYELGEEFKEKIIPHAVDWFTGKALEYEGIDLDDDEEDEEDSSDEEDDSD